MSPVAAATLLFALATLSVAFLTAMILVRYQKLKLLHQERLAVIDKGGALPAFIEERPKAPWSPRVYLLRGMMWTFVGVAMVLVLVSVSISTAHPTPLYWRLSEAQGLRSQGATEDQVKQFLAEAGQRNDGLPIGAASLGLIPISVGLAYLVFYKKETRSPLTGPGMEGR